MVEICLLNTRLRKRLLDITTVHLQQLLLYHCLWIYGTYKSKGPGLWHTNKVRALLRA